MQIFVDTPPPPERMAIHLISDNWDDYGFKTTFEVRLHLANLTRIDLGDVKIGFYGQESGERTRSNLEALEDELGRDYVSLGQSISYYEALARLPATVRSEYLRTMRDATHDIEARAHFSSQEVWVTSILRFDSASLALEHAALVLEDAPFHGAPRDFMVRIRAQGDPAIDLRFSFAPANGIQSRIAAIIGYNGTGKTTSLARLALIAHSDQKTRAARRFRSEYGQFVGQAPKFAAVIMVSYSAFDTFELPQNQSKRLGGISGSRKTEVFGYSYCGLRDISSAGVEQLKKPGVLADEATRALSRALKLNRRLTLRALATLRREPSFAQILPDDTSSQWVVESFPSMSSGHKIVICAIFHLCAYLKPESLVLFDEPESHLHPSLLAALMNAMEELLNETGSQAVVATHSPVVLQELPAHAVQVLTNQSGDRVVRGPGIETFGENIGAIVRDVFHLSADATDYHAKLDRLLVGHTAAEVEGLFPLGLGVEAWAYVNGRWREGGS
ncbi:putative AbiEii toxin of type IV toxin-antitoxin system [Promicromonospora sp. AC04]|uniref:AAA family ATPase n=1 Tax=Promicromonospora sp. AC04 TaxID=2135723 RepID=UPI000D4885AF|nr:AAA family ATPase [Promicromonospora sp. AC04]PUB26804.1 putative AbiEii toxin of type IV toxin-antitoxin system [Promicromonospora sp. AC04]